LARTFDGFVVIPRAQLLGLLWHFSAQAPDFLPAHWLEETTERAVSDIESISKLGSGGGDDLVYALSLMETAELPERYRRRLARRIKEVAPAVVSLDPEEWGSYCITPLKLAPSPESFVASLMEAAVQAQLDYVIDQQALEGCWEPSWTWGDAYPETWPQARREWCGYLTLETLTSLRAYGRL
jgi:hypothetical protein